MRGALFLWCSTLTGCGNHVRSKQKGVIPMRYEDIAKLKLGTVLLHTRSRRLAILCEIFGPPVCSASIQYLEGDLEFIAGCALKDFQATSLRRGTLLRDCKSNEKAVLL